MEYASTNGVNAVNNEGGCAMSELTSLAKKLLDEGAAAAGASDSATCGGAAQPETAPVASAPGKTNADHNADDEALRRLRSALAELRLYLPKGLARLPDDKLLALVSWQIMAAWTRLVEGMPR